MIEDNPMNEKTWKHVNTGKLYRIIAFGVQEDTCIPLVIYQDANGTIWTRTCADFFDGRFIMAGTHITKDAAQTRRESQRANIKDIVRHAEDETPFGEPEGEGIR